MSAQGSKLSIFAAIAANISIAIMKFIAAFFTSSSAMLSEGIHSLIDTSNGLILLFGIRKSKIGPDKLHPFGHGKEIYFWSFIVSILIFSLGGGVAIYEGIHRITHPIIETNNSNIIWNYAVLIGAIIFESSSLYIALKQFRKKQPIGFKSALTKSKDSASIAVIIEDTAAVTGLTIALAGISIAHIFEAPVFDAVSSILIGILLVYVAYFMAKETKKLLIGESALPSDIEQIKNILKQYKEIEFFGNIRTMHLAPDQIMAGIEINFADDLRVSEIEKIVADIKRKIQKANPKIKHIYLESNSINKSTQNI